MDSDLLVTWIFLELYIISNHREVYKTQSIQSNYYLQNRIVSSSLLSSILIPLNPSTSLSIVSPILCPFLQLPQLSLQLQSLQLQQVKILLQSEDSVFLPLSKRKSLKHGLLHLLLDYFCVYLFRYSCISCCLQYLGTLLSLHFPLSFFGRRSSSRKCFFSPFRSLSPDVSIYLSFPFSVSLIVVVYIPNIPRLSLEFRIFFALDSLWLDELSDSMLRLYSLSLSRISMERSDWQWWKLSVLEVSESSRNISWLWQEIVLPCFLASLLPSILLLSFTSFPTLILLIRDETI